MFGHVLTCLFILQYIGLNYIMPCHFVTFSFYFALNYTFLYFLFIMLVYFISCSKCLTFFENNKFYYINLI